MLGSISKIRLMVVDDHEIIRAGVRRHLQDDYGIDLVCEAENGLDAIRMLKAAAPDVVVLDIMLPDLSGFIVAERMLRLNPKLKIVMNSSTYSGFYAYVLTRLGVGGYVVKTAPLTELAMAIRAMGANHHYFSQPVLDSFIHFCHADSSFKDFLPRELEVIYQLLLDKPIKSIADLLCVSIQSIYNYRTRILQKFEVKTLEGLRVKFNKLNIIIH